MNETIFNKIIEKLKTLDSLKDDSGDSRVYDYMNPDPDGYPAVMVRYTETESRALDTDSDAVEYRYIITLMQEKMSENFGPSKAERVTREREYEIAELFRNDSTLGLSGVKKTTPIRAVKTYTADGARIVLDIDLGADTIEEIK